MGSIVIVGIGPVGGILAAHFIRAGWDVLLVDILRDRLKSILSKGLKIRDPRRQISGDFVVHPKRIAFAIEDIPRDVDMVFICTKTYSLMDVVGKLKNMDFPATKIVVYQNGLDNEDHAGEVLNTKMINRNITNFAGMMASDNEIEVTFFNRPNYIGNLTSGDGAEGRMLAEILSSSGIETHFTSDIKKPEWEKAILNASLAPISAVTGLTMKDVMDDPSLKAIVENLLKESIQISQTIGIQLEDDFFSTSLTYLSKGGYHKPSMLLDIENGMRTEIDFLNGRIVEYGEKYNVPVSYNKTITAILKGMEKKQSQRHNPS